MVPSGAEFAQIWAAQNHYLWFISASKAHKTSVWGYKPTFLINTFNGSNSKFVYWMTILELKMAAMEPLFAVIVSLIHHETFYNIFIFSSFRQHKKHVFVYVKHT